MALHSDKRFFSLTRDAVKFGWANWSLSPHQHLVPPESSRLEKEFLERISSADSTHPGFTHLPAFLDSFEFFGHLCLSLEVLFGSVHAL